MLCPFSKIIVASPLELSCVPGQVHSTRYEFPFVGWVLNPIREQLFTPQHSGHYGANEYILPGWVHSLLMTFPAVIYNVLSSSMRARY